jgi:hypothetical protein
MHANRRGLPMPPSMRRPADEFVETAEFTILGTVLMKKGEFGLVEFPEKLIPADLVQAFILGSKIDPQDARVSVFLGGFHGGWPSFAFFNPSPDGFVISGRLAVAHRCLHLQCLVRNVTNLIWFLSLGRRFFVIIIIIFEDVPRRCSEILAWIKFFRFFTEQIPRSHHCG